MALGKASIDCFLTRISVVHSARDLPLTHPHHITLSFGHGQDTDQPLFSEATAEKKTDAIT